ncbi:hypothetical protein M433DRAFT_74313 [Acidomyces richmondensis BFW]|nr:hypothetical protein M433DRAFT_74313 [Acidomyces richmondensis BFW]
MGTSRFGACHSRLNEYQLLHCGNIEADEGWLIGGAGAGTATHPAGHKTRRKGVIISVLIEHPSEGLILFETGAGRDYPKKWGTAIHELFTQVDYTDEHELPSQIKKAGYDIRDVKMVIMGHLHLDHAGGLENFKGTEVPILVHSEELKYAWLSITTKTDHINYRLEDLDPKLNWQAVYQEYLEIVPGIILHHCPGHTPGLMIMQVNLRDSGTWIFTTDHYHVVENYTSGVSHGWLARNHQAWIVSHEKVKNLQKLTNARLVFGHCTETFNLYGFGPHT